MIKKEIKESGEEIEYFDAHSHLHSDFFNNKKSGQKVAEEMKEKKVYSVIIGVNYKDSQKALLMASENENLYSSIGIHPADEEKENWNEENFQKIIESDKKRKVVSVGECGLDYYWPYSDFEEYLKKEINQRELKNNTPKKEKKIMLEKEFLEKKEKGVQKEKERQKKLFEKQIDFAVKNELPLMLHVRSYENLDAHYDVLEILDKKQKEIFGKSFEESLKNNTQKINANFHFFTENVEMVREIIKRGFYISLPGVITFFNVDKSIIEIPMEKIMSETDSPFATPEPFRKEVNTPLYVSEIVKKIAEIKNIKENEVKEKIIENTLKFFNL